MHTDAARLKGQSDSDQPYTQPMRPAARGQIARNPSTDQKRQRRQQMRKSAEWTPGHMSCSSCGYTGHPRLGDTGAECAHCGSYSVKSTKPNVPADYNSRYLTPQESAATQPQHSLVAAKEDACPDCGSTNLSWQSHPTQDRDAFRCNDCARVGEDNEVGVHYTAGARFDQCGYCGIENASVKDGLCPAHESHRNDGWDGYGQSGSDEDTWNPKAAYPPRQAARGDKCRMCSNTVDDSGALCDPCRVKNERAKRAAKTATVLDTRAEMLNPNDQLQMPNGRTQKVLRVRPHETDGHHVYVDTDGGTTLVERGAAFKVVPKNSQQQSLPGYGVPGGNSNHLPGDVQNGGDNSAPSSKCPNCGGPGTLARQGDHYSCSRCGYKEKFGGAGNHAFSDNSSVVRTFSTINSPFQSAVARRATALLNQSEETQ